MRQFRLAKDMNTFRADIDAANDNRVRLRRNWLLAAAVILLTLAGFAYVQGRIYLFSGLPSLPDKAAMWDMNLKPNITIKDVNGKVIGHRGPYLGKPLRLDDMPKYLPDAFLAIEDERFYEHAGVDRRAIFRAFFANTRAGRTVQGGSTLTQQLVKNMLLTPEQSYRRKFQEMWLASEMEDTLGKPEILRLYLNRIDLGNRAFGIDAASQRYFGKSAVDITLSEAAMLAGLPKAPSRYDPSRNYDGAWERAQLVLERMVVNNYITEKDRRAAVADPPVILDNAEDLIPPEVLGHVFDYISERAKGLVGSQHRDLVIHTSLNVDMQLAAQEALTDILAASGKAKKVSDGAVLSVDTRTGAIRAFIGGKDYNTSKFNRVIQAKRQPGSSFKAFVYAAALENGFTPGTVRVDQPTRIGNWSPENYTKRYRGPMTVRQALKLSINTIAAQVGRDIGPDKVVELAKRFGITTDLRPTYSIALGTYETTLLDMTRGYMVFANSGVKREPYIIEAIENTSGTPLYKYRNVTPERVYSAPYARQMTMMLRDVIDTGTGRGAQLGDREAAGKTGTSQDYRDAWFIGFTADLTTGVWMGNDDNSTMNNVTGGLLPVDVWKKYMVVAQKGVPLSPLSDPDMKELDVDVLAMINFYKELADDLTTERNLAAGITPG